MRFANLILCLLILACLAMPAWSECSGGPGCPMCGGQILADAGADGTTGAKGPLLSPGEAAVFSLYCPGNEGKGISNCRFGITPRLEAGVGYSWDNSKLLGSANYLIRTEDSNSPDVTLGIGSRRTGGSDSSALLSVGKSLRLEQTAIRLSCGLAYTLKQSDTETMDPMTPHRDPKASIVAGASVALGRSMAGGLQYDGESLHAMLTRRIGTANVSLLLLEMRDVGVSVGYSFSSRSQ